MKLPFTKMEGAGNDYVFVDGIREQVPLHRAPELARRWSDRHFGIGADGLIVLLRGTGAALRMVMWNADGSRGAMCGNGLRCLARLAFEHGHVRERSFTIETDAGPRRVELLGDGAVRTDMGDVRCGAPATIEVGGQRLTFVPGDAGNPHAVVFVDDVEAADVPGIGAAMQVHPDFPGGVNVEFVQVLGRDRLSQRTFERGSGETLACGTGAAVAAAAARLAGHTHGDATTILLRGGVLHIRQNGSSLAIEGPTRTVFCGEVELPE
ncbi:MAG TPA: diaminopimelate epimerase [Planctomycetota bacterium]|nr:diaminopimelate epimerase [Planctomycetota bacterium]